MNKLKLRKFENEIVKLYEIKKLNLQFTYLVITKII